MLAGIYANFEVRGDLFIDTVAELKNNMKKIVFTGGGRLDMSPSTFVNVGFIERLEVHYIGDKYGIEHQEILKSGLNA